MKCLAFVLGLALLSCAAADEGLEDFLTASLLKLKKEMPAGIPSLGIQPMDPFPLPDYVERLHSEMLDLGISMQNAEAAGLSTFDPRSVSIRDHQVQIKMAFPAVQMSADYQMNGTILGMPISAAHGSAEATVMDIEGVFTAFINKTEMGIFYLFDTQVSLQEGSSVLSLQRFPSIDRIIKRALRMIVDQLLEKNKPVLEAGLNKALEQALNAALFVRGVHKDNEISGFSLPEATVYEAGNANEFIDHMISMARPTLAEKDPLTLPEARHGFEKKILGITVHGEAKIYDGFLAGIQTIHRTGDSEMNQSPDMTSLQISAHMGMSNLHGHYRMHAKFMNIGPTGEVSLKVSMVSCEIKVKVDLSTGKPKAVLETFDITHIGKIDVYFDGLGPLDWLINPLGGWIINLVKHKIADAIEGPVKAIIQSKMDSIDMPFPG